MWFPVESSELLDLFSHDEGPRLESDAGLGDQCDVFVSVLPVFQKLLCASCSHFLALVPVSRVWRLLINYIQLAFWTNIFKGHLEASKRLMMKYLLHFGETEWSKWPMYMLRVFFFYFSLLYFILPKVSELLWSTLWIPQESLARHRIF